MPAFTVCAPEVLVIEKSGAITTNDSFWVFCDGAPAAFAAIVIVNVPAGVLVVVLMLNPTAAGLAEVGFTELEG